MIQFKVDSLGKNSENGTFWQGLNAASVALQQAAQSEAVVYQVFGEQLVKLGLHGSVSLLDETGENLYIASIVFSKKLMQLVNQAEKLLGISSVGYTYSADASPSEAIVLKGDIVFLEDNNEKMRQVIPPRIFRYASPFMKPFLNIPAVLAPIFTQSKVVGVLYLAGPKVVVEDVPAIAAFATHLSIALENARLFQAVQQAENQYRQLFESANDGIFRLDPSTRLLLSANSKMLSMLGISDAELDEVRPSRMVSPEIYTLYTEHLEKALKEGSHFFEVPFVTRDGRSCHWQISANLVVLNGKPVLNGVVRDITAARKSEQALRQREEQFRVLAENVPGTIYLCKNEPNLPFLYINDGIETLTGYTKDKFIRQDVIFHELVHPDDGVDKKTPLDIIYIQQKQTIQHVYRVQHRSGAWRWVEDIVGGVFDDQGNLLFLEGVISDITERFQADLLQKTVYRIAAVAHTSASLEELYRAIHESLSLILDVKNFYIALYDKDTDKMDVPYFVDKFGSDSEGYPDSAALAEIVIRTNSSHLLTQDQIATTVEQSKLAIHGVLPQVWLGVPLQGQEGAIGALVVQSYEASTAYSEQDRQFLTFVSEQTASVIERRRAEERRLQLSDKLAAQIRLREAILAATPDNFLVFDLDGRFQFVSPAVLNFLGVTGDEVVGKTWRELKLPEAFGVELNETY
ncbi:MAG: PAS domain S-box protein [Ardenticatenaceae bacterium]|nr:PAS domain S-box protein [Ardenticatenaceae bacterium]